MRGAQRRAFGGNGFLFLFPPNAKGEAAGTHLTTTGGHSRSPRPACCVVSSFICKGDDVLNALNYNRSNCFSFIKRTAICILFIEWYMLFSPYFNFCEANPPPLQPELVNPRKIEHEGMNSSSMPFVSFFGQDQTAILISFEESLQLWVEGYNEGLCVLSSRFSFLSGICENVVKVNRNQDQKQSGQRNRTDSEYTLVHAFFWLVIMPLIAALISIFYTQQ